MKLTIKFTKYGPTVIADDKLSALPSDEYYAMLSDAIQTLQTYALGQYATDESSESND
jgi:hypothetical protein